MQRKRMRSLEEIAPSLVGRRITATEQDDSGNTILTLDDARRVLLVGDYDGDVVCEVSQGGEDA